jgi:glyoxalase family protein
MGLVQGNHHLTFAVGPAQEDYDFHTGLLGLRSIKKTVLYDGKTPIYHLYYGNRAGDVSTLLTSFPFRQAGVMGRRGSNQIKRLNLSVPADAISFWADRFAAHGVPYEQVEVFAGQRLHFAHPCGIEYGLVGEAEIDDRHPHEGNGIAAENAIRGAHGVTISVLDPGEMTEFLEIGLGARRRATEGPLTDFEIGNTGYGRSIELLHEPGVPPGTWRFGEGTVHHVAYDVTDAQKQQELKDWLEGLGYTDCSESKDREYFHSVYCRSPGGALVELAYTTPVGFLKDEDFEHLGSRFLIPPRFEDRRDEIMGTLETIQTEKVAG